MDKTALVLIMVGLLVVFIALVAVYVWIGRSKKAVEPAEQTAVTFETLQGIIHRSSSTNGELNGAVDMIVERYGDMRDRGVDVYAALLEKLCIHPHTDSKVILRFEKALRGANPHHKEEIDKALKHGLEQRDKR